MPSDTWPQAIIALLPMLAGVQDWRLDLSDRTAKISALAPDAAAREKATTDLGNWAGHNGFSLTLKLATGPRSLPVKTVATGLTALADCGRLAIDRPADESYALGDTIRVTGTVAQDATTTRIAAQLAATVGDRALDIATTTLNTDLCAVRKVLPDVPDNALSIWMGNGDTGQANPTGVYHVGQNPLVEVLAPATLTEGSLWVAVVDNTSKVFNVLPNINLEEHDLIDSGIVENGVRRIRVLNSIADFTANNRLLAMQVSNGNFGKSEIVAILSRNDLFRLRRPRDESIASFAEALAAIQREEPGNIIGLASRLLDSRP